MQYLKANTAVDVLIGPFVDDTDGKTAETALTISQADVKLSKNGQALAQKNDDTAAAHDANGYYNCELDATDTNTEGTLVLVVSESGALPVRHELMVLSEAAYDSLFAAKDTGYMDVNVKAISEDTTAADNCESMYDGTGYAGGTIAFQADLTKIHGTALTESVSGYLAAGFKKVFDVATPVFTAESVNQSADNNTILANATYGLSALKTHGDSAWITATSTTVSDKTGFSLADGAITAAKIAASALDDKGNWNVGKTGYTLTTQDWNTTTPPTTAQIKTAIEAAGSHLTLILEDTGTTLPATLTTMEGKIDTVDGIVDAVLEDTGTTIPATLDGLATKRSRPQI